MKLYHNAACGKSRMAHKQLLAKYSDLEIRNYLEKPLSADEVLELMARSEHSAEEFVRWDDARMLGIKMDDKSNPETNAALIAKQPKVMQRPLVDTGEKVLIARSEDVLASL